MTGSTGQCTYSQAQKDDRSFYLQCIIELAPAKGENGRIYSEVLARDDQEERYWWFAAVGHLDIMRALQTKPQGNAISSGLSLLFLGAWELSPYRTVVTAR